MLRRCSICSWLLLLQLVQAAENQENAGCCFTIGYGSQMVPCCLTTEDLGMEECYSAETRDVGVLLVQAQKGQGIGGSRAAHALGAERGWRRRCPVDAEEANTFILDDQDDRESQALGVSMQHKAENALPWWGWIFIITALSLAIVVGVAQVLEEHHKERVRLRNVKSGEGIEEAREAIRRWTRSSSQIDVALREISSPSSALMSHSQSPSPQVARAAQLPVFPPVFQVNGTMQVQPAMAYSAVGPPLQSQAGKLSPASPAVASGGFSPMVQVSHSVYQAAGSANTG